MRCNQVVEQERSRGPNSPAAAARARRPPPRGPPAGEGDSRTRRNPYPSPQIPPFPS